MMVTKDIIIEVMAECVREAYQEGRLSVICGSNDKWKDSECKRQIDDLMEKFNSLTSDK